MAWYNPFSWGGGPDEVDYGQLEAILGQIQQRGLGVAKDIQGTNFGVTAEDQQQYGQSYGFMRDMVTRDLMQNLPPALQAASGQAGARGLGGSSLEGIMRANVAMGAQRNAADVLSQFGSQQAGLMQQGALQRGQAGLQKNQLLWQTLMQSYQPQLQYQQGRVQSEEDRIASEKGAFGSLLGKAVGIIPGL